MPLKIIKDPVHGYVEVEEYALDLLDSPALQRLRYIRQLGFSYLVYPGANHTRFEHSLGTMYLADTACRKFGFSDEERKLVSAAALLHDIGHGPFSHASEPLLEEYLHRTHDDISEIVHDRAGSILLRHGIDPEEVRSIVRGQHPLAGIIHGELDVDRMDYLLRDAYYTGAPYGTVDAQRLIRHMIRTDEGFVLDENGINAAESLLIARTLMRPTVYYHHVSRIGESMFHLAVQEHLRETSGNGKHLLEMDDMACMQALRTSKNETARALMFGIYRRRLFKRALYAGADQVNAAEFTSGISLQKSRALAVSIARSAGVGADTVLVDIPPFPTDMSMGVQVKNRHVVVSFEEISPRMHTLNATRREQWRLGVYTLPDQREAVLAAATEILHVKKPTRQDKLF
ncbi:MAG: deoxyguanosinetriphosphate triphosphohydrolase-like protein [Methanoregula sp. PtaU1.Bin051]|nr:MAG: deoxyguanosinetriphosphate triphosphohydrolase-like protein [Methanoregula sp. PtaU1.Bin051]